MYAERGSWSFFSNFSPRDWMFGPRWLSFDRDWWQLTLHLGPFSIGVGYDSNQPYEPGY